MADYDSWMADESDPTKPSTNYVPFPEGLYPVAGIFKFGNTDPATNEPYFKDTNGRPATRIHLRKTDGEEGPPMICEPALVVGLVLAFQGEDGVKLLEGYVPLSPAFLIRAKAIINGELPELARAPRQQTAKANARGWVSSVTGSRPEKGLFRWMFAGARNVDGSNTSLADLAYRKDNYNNEVVVFDFEMVGDLWGNPSPFNGWRESIRVEQAFDGVAEVVDPDGGKRFVPKGRVSAAGGRPKAVARIQRFVEIFWPGAKGYRWESDPTKSTYGINEASNPIVVIAGEALKAKQVGLNDYTRSKSDKLFLDMESFQPVPDAPQGIAPVPVENQAGATLNQLRNLIIEMVQIAYDSPAFVDEGFTLSEKGKEWCVAILAGDWDRLGLPPERALAILTDEQAQRVIDFLCPPTASSGSNF